MTDLDSIESSVRRVSAMLGVLLVDQGPLVIASTLDAAVEAIVRVRRYLMDGVTPPDELRAVVEFMDELIPLLTTLVDRDAVAR
jgi:ascorbate-specific PTS system EIIC-type component UlaA